MVNTYTESEFKTILACSRLHHLGGSIEAYDKSQLYLIKALDGLFLRLVKENFDSIDTLIDTCVKKAFLYYYKNETLDSQVVIKLKEYAYSFLNSVMLYFNKDYQIVYGPTQFFLEYPEARINISISGLFKPTNRKGYLHVVCFVPYIDKHLIKNDFFIRLKAFFFKQYTTTSVATSKHSEVVIHLLSAAPFHKYRSNKATHAFYHKNIPIKEIAPYDPSKEIELVNILKDKNQIIPMCQNKKCLKRSSCFE